MRSRIEPMKKIAGLKNCSQLRIWANILEDNHERL